MAQFAQREAIVRDGETMRYDRLVATVEDWRDALDRLALRPGSVVGVAGADVADACAVFLALVSNGHAAAPLPADGAPPADYLASAGIAGIIELRGSGKWTLSRLDPPEPPELLRQLAERRAGGVVVFSSGTTGQPKAGLFDFATLSERYREPRRGYRTLLFLQLDHLGGIHTMLHSLAHGGTLVVSDERRPDAVCRAIEHHRVELLPATPTFLRMLALSDAWRRHDLSSLRLITYGTEPMPPATLETLTALFPDVRFKQTYGLSELGVLPSRSKAQQSLWLQLGGVGCETRVVDNVLWIRSQTPMLGYLNAPRPFDAEGWYNTEDEVEVDGPYLRILGRSTDLINVGGQKVYPAEVENALLEMDNVREATVWGRPNPVTGQIVAARLSLAQPEEQDALEARLHRFCRERLAPYKVPLSVEIAEGDHHNRRFKKIRPTTAGKTRWPARSS